MSRAAIYQGKTYDLDNAELVASWSHEVGDVPDAKRYTISEQPSLGISVSIYRKRTGALFEYVSACAFETGPDNQAIVYDLDNGLDFEPTAPAGAASIVSAFVFERAKEALEGTVFAPCAMLDRVCERNVATWRRTRKAASWFSMHLVDGIGVVGPVDYGTARDLIERNAPSESLTRLDRADEEALTRVMSLRVTERAYDVLARECSRTGKPKGRIVSDLLEGLDD